MYFLALIREASLYRYLAINTTGQPAENKSLWTAQLSMIHLYTTHSPQISRVIEEEGYKDRHSQRWLTSSVKQCCQLLGLHAQGLGMTSPSPSMAGGGTHEVLLC